MVESSSNLSCWTAKRVLSSCFYYSVLLILLLQLCNINAAFQNRIVSHRRRQKGAVDYPAARQGLFLGRPAGMGNNNMKREHQLLFTMADPRDAPQHPQITTTTAKKRNEYDARSMFSRHPQRGYQGTRSMPEADFSFLKKFASTEDIDAFIQRLVTERKKGTLILNDGDISSAKESSLSFANESVFASPVLLEPTLSDLLSWTNRDEAAFVRALRERGAYKAAVDYVLGGSAIAHHPSVYLYTATLTTLAVWRQQRDFNNDHRNHHREMCWTVLDEMDRHQIPPTPYTLTALFQAYCFSPFDAVTLRRELVYRYPNNTHALWTEPVWEAAINACAAAAGGVATTANPTDVNATWEAAEGLYRDLLDQLLLSTKTEGDHISSCLGTASIKSGKVPSARMLIAVFHVCAVTKNVDKAISFLDTLLSRDSYGNSTRPFRMTPRLWAAVLKVCALAGDHEQARTILERMSTEGLCPNVRHCTAYLKAMVVDKKAQVAASFLEHMAEVGFGTRTNSDDTLLFPRIQVPSPDMIAVKTCLVGCASIGNFTLARRILTQVKNGFYGEKVQHELDEQCYNIALSACNDPESAKELVREMRLTRRYRVGVIPPSKATFTRAITVCRKARNVESARFFLSGARNDGVDPDAFMYSAAIWTAAQANNCNAALEILTEMKACNCSPTISSYNGVIAALSSCGRADEAVSVFREMKKETPNLVPDFTSFFHLAGAIRKVRGDEEKVALLWRIYALMGPRERQVDVGGRVIEALISSYGALGHFQEAMNIFRSIKGPSDTECLRAILFACSLADPPKWETALSLLLSSDIVEGGEGPAHVEPGALCNAMLACSKAGEWEESLQLLRLYGGRNASVFAVNSLIAACGRGGRADMAMEVFYEMGEYGLRPDNLSYRSAIMACNQAEHEQRRSWRQKSSERNLNEEFEWWECAISLLRRMKESGLRPDTPTLSSAISACEAAGQWQLALGILQSAMHDESDEFDNGLNLYCFNAAIAACEKGGAWVEALEIYERMKEQGGHELRPNIVTLNSLILALDTAGQKELAVNMYEDGLHKKFIKSPWRLTLDSVTAEQIKAIDLHSYSAALARAAIRSHMDALHASTDLDSRMLADDLTIIVGKGLRSEAAVPVLKKAVHDLLQSEYGITATVDGQNEGRLLIPSSTLRQFVDSRSWR